MNNLNSLSSVLLAALLAYSATPYAGIFHHPPHPIKVNQAQEDELAKVRGIGKHRAHTLVAFREHNGPIHDVESLKRVSGFDDKVLKRIHATMDFSA